MKDALKSMKTSLLNCSASAEDQPTRVVSPSVQPERGCSLYPGFTAANQYSFSIASSQTQIEPSHSDRHLKPEEGLKTSQTKARPRLNQMKMESRLNLIRETKAEVTLPNISDPALR